MLTPVTTQDGAQGSTRALLSQIDNETRLAIGYLDARADSAAADDVVEWLMHLRISRGLQPSTISTYCVNLARFLMWVRDQALAVDSLGINDIETWQKWMYVERRFGDQFRKQHITAVRQYFAWRETFHNKPSPAKFVRGPKVTKKAPKKYSTSDLQKLFATCDLDTPIGVRDYAILIFLYATGARRFELQQLSLDQITMRERVARVKFKGKGAKERELSFQGGALDALRQWLAVRDTLQLVDASAMWVTVRGSAHHGKRLTLRAIEHMVARRAKKAGIKESGIHMMRVTFATDLYDAGLDIEIIQELMGHEKIETTRRYIVVSEKRLKARMPVSRINLVTGRASGEQPLWIRQKHPTLFDD